MSSSGKRERDAGKGKRKRVPPASSLEELLELKQERHLEEFSSALQEVMRGQDRDLRALACFELALLRCQQGRHKEADICLRRLGYRFKLSRHIWQYKEQNHLVGPNTGMTGLVRCYDEVLPPMLLRKLQNIFASCSPFWTEHDYPSDAFFSYNVPLSKSKKNIKDDKPSNLMEQLAYHLKPVVEASFPDLAIGDTSSIEWWAHTRANGSSAGHRLHYDLDEVSLHESGELSSQIHPYVSSVLYLDDGGSSGAPTFVTNQSVLSNCHCNCEDTEIMKENEEMAWMCPPKTNRILLFEGSLLHGVVPYLIDCDGGSNVVKQSPRVTVMIGWWGSHVATTTSPTISRPHRTSLPILRDLKPNMEMPSTKSNLLTWPSLFKVDENFNQEHSRKCANDEIEPSESLVHITGDIWEPVEESTSRKHEKMLKSNVQFLGNWFLKCRTEILDEILYACESSKNNGEEDENNAQGAVGWISAEELKLLRGE